LSVTQATNENKLLLLELNEANRELLQLASKQLSLKSLSRLVKMPCSQTETEDSYESDYLEPWSQWVSIHTGRPATSHHVKHLGDFASEEFPSIWETLSENGISTGVWGVMNGRPGKAKRCSFFLADPWVFDVETRPESLACMTDLATHLAKNYLQPWQPKILGLACRYAIGLFANLKPSEIVAATGIFLEGLSKFGPSNLVLGAFFEYASACAFMKARARFKPQFSILFLNLLAHTQHHYWFNEDSLSPQLSYSFKVIDAILEKAFLTPDSVLIANGFSQTNTNHEPSWILYRPHDPLTLMRAIGIFPSRIEPLMTHDLHVWFDSDMETELARRALNSATIKEKKLFLVEADAIAPRKLFVRLQFTDAVDAGESFFVLEKPYRFEQYFKTVVTRTGKHNATGFVFQTRRLLPEALLNHQINHYICKFFAVKNKAELAELAL